MYCLEFIKFDVFSNTYYVEVQNGVLLRYIMQSWKMIFGVHGKAMENFQGERVRTLDTYMMNMLVRNI